MSTPKRRFVTIVYEIIDQKEFNASGNPLNHVGNGGLKAVGVSVGDLMGLCEDVEPHVDIPKWSELYHKHVITSLPVARVIDRCSSHRS